jgi:hypothetical protein
VRPWIFPGTLSPRRLTPTPSITELFIEFPLSLGQIGKEQKDDQKKINTPTSMAVYPISRFSGLSL